MKNAPFQRVVIAATLSLVAFGVCVAAFLPPLNERTLDSPLLAVLAGLAIAASVALHLVFVGIGARRLGRSPVAWVAIALLTFPLGSIVGLVLLEWFDGEGTAGSLTA